MNNYDGEEYVNVGIGQDDSNKELAETVKEVVNFQGKLKFDTSKPDGTRRKLLDISKLENTSWKARINLGDGVESTYKNGFRKI